MNHENQPSALPPDSGNDSTGAEAVPAYQDGRRICTKADPYTKEKTGPWLHPEAIDDGYNDPYYDHYDCPVCGLSFKEEVAE